MKKDNDLRREIKARIRQRYRELKEHEKDRNYLWCIYLEERIDELERLLRAGS